MKWRRTISDCNLYLSQSINVLIKYIRSRKDEDHGEKVGEGGHVRGKVEDDTPEGAGDVVELL